jgi:cytochrome c biogenesis protein CcdA
MTNLNFIGITFLALADSINPCAIAVLTMILIAIMTQNPDKRKKILFGGIAFISSVFIAYLVYGLIIIQFFQTFAIFMRENSTYIYNSLAIIAMLIGALNIKNYFMYKKGSLATEMPIFMRPTVKKIIKNIASTKGAFAIGFIVSLFLLPCTMGPYIVASGLLAKFGTLVTIPWLLYYNLLFVTPMIIIVGLVYWGFTKVNDVSGWKERNIKLLHLISGILLFLVGVGLLMGWI